tara:strand:+ start:1449 stop:3629 length:2181 start_codon:yes stop_codon:yes gene_type:complete
MASTYGNDLRLEEIGDGEQSGTWGATTNTNLELIAEALSFGTEVITTNADTHTTTIADGATDPGRSLYLKYTGTLDSTCTITIAPNSISKTWYIENGTSGSQSIIISQGSGANVTIPTGQTKVVYSDGAGSGAAMAEIGTLGVTNLAVTTNATVGGTLGVTGVLTGTSLDISGNVDIDGTLETDALSINSTAVTSTAAELNILDGVTATTAELNIMDGVTATTAELNIMDGVTSTTAELNILDGVTSTTTEINQLDAITRGSILYGNASGETARLAAGGADTVLTSDGTDLSWAAAGGAFMGSVINVTSSGETTLTAAQSGSLIVISNAEASIKLPTSAAGLFFGLRNTTQTAIPIRGQTGGIFINSLLAPIGIAESDGFAIIVGIDSTHWAADYQVATANVITKFVNTTNSQSYSVPLTIDSSTTAIYIAIMSGVAEVGYGGTGSPPTYTNPGQAGSGFGETLITSNFPTTLTVAGAYAVSSAASTGYGTAGRMTVTNSGGTTVNIVAQPAYGAANYTYNPNSVTFNGGTVTGCDFNAAGGEGRSYVGGTSNPYYNNSNGRSPGGGGSGSTAGVGGRGSTSDATAGTLKDDAGGAWSPQYTGQNGRHGGGTGGNDGTATAGGAAGSKDANSITITPYLGKEFYIPPGHVNSKPTSEGYDSGTFFGVGSGYGGSGASFGRAPSDLINIQGAGNRPLFDTDGGGRGGKAFYSASRINPQCTIIQFKG